MVQSPLETERLTLRPIQEKDARFLVRLVQSEGWLRFIGERKIAGPGEAEAYIRNLLGDPSKDYYVITLKEDREPIGILTYIQRDYLPHRDFGFALLPSYENQGYALEASHAFIIKITSCGDHPALLAITLPENKRSVSLLSKLGFRYEGEVEQEAKNFSLYRLDT